MTRRPWIPCALAGVITFLVYIPSLSNGFVDWDDNVNIVDNAAYRGLGAENLRWMLTAFHLGHYQPLSWVTLGLDYVIWEMKPFGYHLTNALLHAASAAVLALLIASLGASRPVAPASRPAGTSAEVSPLAGQEAGATGASGNGSKTVGPWFPALVALAWSLHPLRVEAVAWVTERREVLCGLLTLLAVGSHLRRGPRWLTWTFAVLAMLAKVTAATIPALLVLIDVHLEGASSAGALLRSVGRAILRQAPIVLVACVLVGTAVLAQREAEAFVSYADLSLARRLVLTLYGATFCLLKSVWPSGLAVLHQGKIGTTWEFQPWLWWQAGVALVLTAAGFVIGWRVRRRSLGCLCLLAAFCVCVLPTGGLGQSGPQTAADRYTYQSGWVLTLAVGLVISSSSRWRARAGSSRAFAAAAIAVLGLLAFLSIRQQRVWFDSESLWRRQIEIHPDSPTGNHQLARHYVAQRPPRFDLAEPRFRAAFAGAPEYVDPQHALGLLLRNTGRGPEAILVFKDIARHWPRHRETWFQLAMLLWESGDTANAVSGFDNYHRLDRSDPAGRRLLAKAQAAAGKPREALATLEAGIASARVPILSADLAWLLATHPDPAIRDGRRALELAAEVLAGGPPDFRTLVMFAAACAEAGDFERGAREVEGAIPKLPPDKEPALRALLEDLAKRKVRHAEPRFP